MTILWSEVQLTYIFIMTIFLGIFRPIGIGLHSRVLHTPQSAHSAMVGLVIDWHDVALTSGQRLLSWMTY